MTSSHPLVGDRTNPLPSWRSTIVCRWGGGGTNGQKRVFWKSRKWALFLPSALRLRLLILALCYQQKSGKKSVVPTFEKLHLSILVNQHCARVQLHVEWWLSQIFTKWYFQHCSNKCFGSGAFCTNPDRTFFPGSGYGSAKNPDPDQCKKSKKP